jgi:broad specificity phosphatase PhoE
VSGERPSVRLLLVRHGRVDPGARLDASTALDEVGRAQAAHVASMLAGTGVTRVFSSPLRRALETGEVVAAGLGLEAEVDALLREFELGVEGATSYEEAQALRPDLVFWRPEHRAHPGAESLGDFQSRVTAMLTAMTLHALPDDVYVLVTHAGVIDAALRWAFGLTSTNAWFIEADVPHGSVTELEHWPRGRHEEGAPRYSVLRRLGDVGGIASELRSE